MMEHGLRSLCLGALVFAVLGCSSGSTGVSGSAGAGSGAVGSSAGSATTGGAGSTSGGIASQGQGGKPDQGGAGTNAVGGMPPEAGAGSGTGGSAGGAVAVGPITCRTKGDDKSTITIVNQCAGTLSFRGSAIEGGELAPGEHACHDVGNTTDEIPAIRYWGFIGEDPGGERHTLAELTLNTDFNDFDWYNISHVDAHNLPMKVVAVEMPDCRVLSCAESLLAGCPAEGRLAGASGELISCFSPNRDDPNSVVAQYFEAACDDAYSWSGDDSESVAACSGGEDYDVIFCP